MPGHDIRTHKGFNQFAMTGIYHFSRTASALSPDSARFSTGNLRELNRMNAKTHCYKLADNVPDEARVLRLLSVGPISILQEMVELPRTKLDGEMPPAS